MLKQSLLPRRQSPNDFFIKYYWAWLYLGVAVICLGTSFQIGFGAGSMNNLDEVLIQSLASPLQTWQWGAIQAGFGIGGLLGATLTNAVLRLVSNRAALLGTDVLVLASSMTFMLSDQWSALFLGRIAIGAVAGIGSGLVPVALAEIVPSASHHRAAAVAHQLSIKLGCLISQLLTTPSLHLGEATGLLGEEIKLRNIFLVPALCALVQVVVLPCLPDASHASAYFYRGGMAAEGRGGGATEAAGRAEQQQQHTEAMAHDWLNSESVFSVLDLLKASKLRKQLLVGGALVLSMQASGIDVLLAYSTMVFRGAGLPNPELATSLLSAVNVLLLPLGAIVLERVASRRTLLSLAWLAMGVAYVLGTLALACTYFGVLPSIAPALAVACISGVLVAFAAGPGCVAWATVIDLFPAHAKDAAVALGVAMNWAANAAFLFAFPLVHSMLGPVAFLIFAKSAVAFAYLTYRFVPETRHKSITEISAEMAERMPG